MDTEILALKGRLQTAKDRLRELEAQASAQIGAARLYLDPFSKPVTRLKVDEAFGAVQRLRDLVVEMKELENLVVELKRALGQ